MAKTYYVYKITNKENQEFYIGYRRTYLKPENDLGIRYFTSGVLKAHFMANVHLYKLEILFIGSKERECFWHEQVAIMQNFNNPLCRNRHFSIKANEHTNKLLSSYEFTPEKKTDKKKRIWSDLHGKFVDLPIDEFNKLKNKERFVNGYGGRSKKVYA